MYLYILLNIVNVFNFSNDKLIISLTGKFQNVIPSPGFIYLAKICLTL